MTSPNAKLLRDIEAQSERRQALIRRLVLLQESTLPALLSLSVIAAVLIAPNEATRILLIVAAACSLIGSVLLVFVRRLGRELWYARQARAHAMWIEDIDEYQRSRNRGEKLPYPNPPA